jgi:hypothetical protein
MANGPLDYELVNLAFIASTSSPTESVIIVPEDLDVYTLQPRLTTALIVMRYVKHIEFQKGHKALVVKVTRTDDSVSVIYVLPLTSREIAGRRINGMLLYYLVDPKGEWEKEEKLHLCRIALLACIMPGARVAKVA